MCHTCYPRTLYRTVPVTISHGAGAHLTFTAVWLKFCKLILQQQTLLAFPSWIHEMKCLVPHLSTNLYINASHSTTNSHPSQVRGVWRHCVMASTRTSRTSMALQSPQRRCLSRLLCSDIQTAQSARPSMNCQTAPLSHPLETCQWHRRLGRCCTGRGWRQMQSHAGQVRHQMPRAWLDGPSFGAVWAKYLRIN